MTLDPEDLNAIRASLASDPTLLALVVGNARRDLLADIDHSKIEPGVVTAVRNRENGFPALSVLIDGDSIDNVTPVNPISFKHPTLLDVGERVLVLFDPPNAPYYIGSITDRDGIGDDVARAWCASDGVVSVPDFGYWSGTLLTIPANTMLGAIGNAFSVDIVIDLQIDVVGTYEAEFSLYNGSTLPMFVWRDVITDVDGGYVNRRLPWQCLVDQDSLGADWLVQGVVASANAVTISTSFTALEVDAPDGPCCVWGSGGGNQ